MANPLYGSENFSTTLNVGGGINNSQTTGIVLTSVSGLDTNGGVLGFTWASTIDSSTYEEIEYGGVSGNELTGVVRGSAGTSAKTHLNGATVVAVVSKLHQSRISDKLTSRDATAIQDPNANEILKTSYVASAVNEVTVTNAATGNGPSIMATGGDSNVPLILSGKGTGGVSINGVTQSATAPSANQVLTASSSSAASWQTPSLSDASATNRKIKMDKLQYATSTTDVNTSSSSYVDFTGLSITFTPDVASNFLVLVQTTSYNSNSGGYEMKFIVDMDGATQGNDPLMYAIDQDNTLANYNVTASGFLWITGVSQASHTIKVKVKTSGGTCHTTYGSLTVIPFAS